MYRLGVLISGRGSNFRSIEEHIKSGYIKNAEVAVVISNKENAEGLKIAKKNSIAAIFADPKGLAKEDYDKNIIKVLNEYNVNFVILAGFMRILSGCFIDAFKNRILNIHPALLPSFKGLHAQKQAIEAGVKFSGATVHFVTKNLDNGPIIVQSVVPVFDNDDEDMLSNRILKTEHKIYPFAVKLLADDKLKLKNNRVNIKDCNTIDENFYTINPKEG